MNTATAAASCSAWRCMASAMARMQRHLGRIPPIGNSAYRMDEIADVGYRYAKGKMEELRGEKSLAGMFQAM